jgi:hypothetical protein
LVTGRIEFAEDNFPAILTAVTPGPFSRVTSNSDAFCSMSEDDDVKRMRFEVSVADVNEEDALEARVIVNGRRVDTPSVSAGGKVQRENLSVCIKHDDLADKCNYVVFAVSRRFKNSANILDVYEDGDLATESFFVLGLAADNAGADPEDCALAVSADAGVP